MPLIACQLVILKLKINRVRFKTIKDKSGLVLTIKYIKQSIAWR